VFRSKRAIPFFGNSFKPFFIGKFQTVNGALFLSAAFTMSTFTKVFMLFWFWVLRPCGQSWLLSRFIHAGQSEAWWFPFAGIGMIAFGAVFVIGAKRLSRNDIDWLSTVIRGALNAAA